MINYIIQKPCLMRWVKERKMDEMRKKRGRGGLVFLKVML